MITPFADSSASFKVKIKAGTKAGSYPLLFAAIP
jgi:hypothetical protein